MHSSFGMRGGGGGKGARGDTENTPGACWVCPKLVLSHRGWNGSTDFMCQPAFWGAVSRASFPPQGCGIVSVADGLKLSSGEADPGLCHPTRKWRVGDCPPGSQIPNSSSLQPRPLPSGSSARNHARLAVLSLGVWGGPGPPDAACSAFPLGD